MPNFVVNKYGVIENPEIITIYSGSSNGNIFIRIAEIDNVYYTGFLLECSSSFASSPCSLLSSDKYDSKDAAILSVLDYFIDYFHELKEYSLLKIVKRYRVNNFTQLTLF